MSTAEALLDVAGPAAPPRTNGELAFAQPWERRLFGVTMALTQTTFAYADFRERLIAQISDDPARSYWRSWELALEDMLSAACRVEPGDLQQRHEQFLARPHGHDHGH
jgi:hypothetical protein